MKPDAGYVALAGPTASGKTAAALAVARERPTEIVSVDSALVYRGMDIGTAKPTAAERAEVPHHLIDIRDPRDSYSAAAFVQDATRLIAEIRGRGRLPLLVGGTMLYFKALADGIDAMPSSRPELRAQIEAEAALLGWPALHARLAGVDPATAARLAPNDSQRIQRALEVWLATGRPLSSFHAARARESRDDQHGDDDNGNNSDEGQVKNTRGLPPLALVSLETDDRAWLHQRVAARFDAMLAAGLVDEVQALRARGDLRPDLPSMRCVGYRQIWEALDAGRPVGDMRERATAATRQLAKRQMTWLRSMPQRRAVDCTLPDAAERVVQLIGEIP
ncbi:MAG: tRNA (adenosine(37)-N6)-dimethylallyltransferase MiaA [Gammaproteobacteria bacterium]|nr:tRNA (adenosine(37)-N6)-dimethylallyltransferase MiaA [Gammaproteobacteria bacterium]MBU1441303.1 tRNA (adenosine(37)-N6)-dimethylallyltransferase MiaA [Gammaproteobacteria bacterium]MBU2287052.1 tRNA (adenosine(37)-N6)-dimethylallyltransferase MiaA [Gammaproteobacteria bacterium]